MYLGDLDLAHRVVSKMKKQYMYLKEKMRKQYMYLKEGSCANVTAWLRWYGVKGAVDPSRSGSVVDPIVNAIGIRNEAERH